MVHPDGPLAQLDAVEVVNGEHGGPLVLEADEAEALALAGDVVADEVDVDDLAVLGEDGEDVALGELVGQAADEEPGGVPVLRGRIEADILYSFCGGLRQVIR